MVTWKDGGSWGDVWVPGKDVGSLGDMKRWCDMER